MGLGKVLLGVGLGVGAIAAAPFTGGGSIVGAVGLAGSLAGAGTVAAAVGAGAVGAVAGGLASINEEGERATEINNAEIKGRKEAIDEIGEQKSDNYNLLLAAVAVGFAVAYCDGVLSSEEEREIDFFIKQLSENVDNKNLVKEILKIKSERISFDRAMTFVEKVPFDDWVIFDEVIREVSGADKDIKPQEYEFSKKWDDFKKQHSF